MMQRIPAHMHNIYDYEDVPRPQSQVKTQSAPVAQQSGEILIQQGGGKLAGSQVMLDFGRERADGVAAQVQVPVRR